jgi:Zn-dependent protease with chaperone function
MTNTPVLTRRLSLTLALFLLVSTAYPQSALPEFPNPGNPHMSRDDQRALGLQAAAQVYKQMPVLPDSSPETQYIRQLGNKLVATIPPQYSWPFEFHVVAQKEINAFALPGGPMFVNIGTITAASNEAELAGVMAHEMSHVIMQHSAKQADKAQWTGLLAGLASGVAGATLGGMAGQAAQMGIQYGAQGLTLKYSRTDESQADAVGAIILYKAGYNPQALADFFKTLESQNTGAPPQILSDHPNPGNREQAIEKEIRNWPPKQYLSNSAAFEKAKAHATGVRAYTGQEIAAGAKSGEWASLNQKNGAVFKPTGATALNASAPVPTGAAPSTPAPNAPAPSAAPVPSAPAVSLHKVQPSEKLVPADLGRMKIARPDNWQVMMPKQKGDSLRIAPPAGIAADAVGYGVVINGVMAPEGENLTIDQITADLVRDMERSGDIKSAGKPQTITINGVQGRAVVMQSQSPFRSPAGSPQNERDWLVTVPQRDGTVIFMVFVAPEAEFSLFQPTYEAMLKSVQF